MSRFSSPGQFGPASIPSLTAWYKADALALSDGNNCTSWTDSSGVTGAAINGAAVAPIYHTNKINSLPAVSFNGSTMGLQTPAITMDAFTWFLVATITTGSMLLEQSVNTNTNSGGYLYQPGGNGIHIRRSAAAITNAGALGISGTHLVEGRYGGASTLGNAWKDGSNIEDTTASSLAAESVSDNVYIMCRALTGLWSQADVGEVLIYTRLLNSTEIGNVENYLSGKWGTPAAGTSSPHSSGFWPQANI